MKKKIITFSNFKEFKDFILSNRRIKKLHTITETNLKILLNDLYPEAYPISEINVNGGRIDLMYYIPPLNDSIHFEIFASESQVINDLRLLEQSESNIKIAILIDKRIDLKVSEKYFRKRPINPFPCIDLSLIFLESKLDIFKDKIKEIVSNSLNKNNKEDLYIKFEKLIEDWEKSRKNKIDLYNTRFVKPFICKFNSYRNEGDLIDFDPLGKYETRKSLISFDDLINSLRIKTISGEIILLLGEAGMGKTTYLHAIENCLLMEEKNKILPLIFHFSIFIDQEYLSPAKLLDLLFYECFSGLKENYFQLFKNSVLNNKTIFLFDGLDEIFTKMGNNIIELDSIINMLFNFSNKFNARIVIAGRPTIWSKRSFISNNIPERNILELIKWDNKLIIKWIDNNKDVYLDNKGVKSNKIFNIIESKGLLELCRTPFLLECCLLIFNAFDLNEKKIIPLNRIQIYKKTIKLCIKVNKLKHLSNIFDIDETFLWKIFQAISLEYLSNKSVNIYLKDIDFMKFSFFEDYERKIIIPKLMEDSEIFYSCMRVFSFLNINEKYGYIFTHQTFAEFLIADLVYSIIKNRRESMQTERVEFFSAKYFSEESLKFLKEMVDLPKNKTSIAPNIDDFIHFMSEKTDRWIITEILLWIDEIYLNEEELRKNLKKFIKLGLHNQTEFQITYDLLKFPYKIPRINKVCYEKEFFNLILKNKNLRLLHFNKIPLNQIPRRIAKLKKLEILSIHSAIYASNLFDNLCKKLQHLKRLRSVYFQISNLKTIPNSICFLKHIKNLYLDSNNIKYLPKSIGELNKLEILSLKFNNIKKIPDTIGGLQSLKELYLEENYYLEYIPETIGNLKSLEILDLEYNELKKLPDSIGNLNSLKELNLNQTYRLKNIPNTIVNLKSLKSLNIYDSMIHIPVKIRNELEKQGCEIFLE